MYLASRVTTGPLKVDKFLAGSFGNGKNETLAPRGKETCSETLRISQSATSQSRNLFYILVAPSLRFYGLMKSSLVLASLALIAGFVFANEKLSDSAIKEKLLGYWGNARHSYLIKSDGVMYMCPRDISTTTNRWDVKDGKFYLDSDPHEIVVLTDKKFVYRTLGAKPFTFSWTRLTEKEAEGK